MKKYIILFLLFFYETTAQVHIKKQQFVQFNIGAFDKVLPSLNNQSVSVEFGKYNKKINGSVLGFTYSHKANLLFDTQNQSELSLSIPVDQYIGFYRTDIKLYQNTNSTFFIKALGRINFGYESLNKDKTKIANFLLSKNSSFLLGAGTGLEIESTPIVLGIITNFNFLSTVQKFNTYPYIGFRIHL